MKRNAKKVVRYAQRFGSKLSTATAIGFLQGTYFANKTICDILETVWLFYKREHFAHIYQSSFKEFDERVERRKRNASVYGR